MINTNETSQIGWFDIIKKISYEMKSIAHNFARFFMQVAFITSGLLALPVVIALNLLTKLVCSIFQTGQLSLSGPIHCTWSLLSTSSLYALADEQHQLGN